MKTDKTILKKLAFPPFYFFASIVIMILCYFILFFKRDIIAPEKTAVIQAIKIDGISRLSFEFF